MMITLSHEGIISDAMMVMMVWVIIHTTLSKKRDDYVLFLSNRYNDDDELKTIKTYWCLKVNIMFQKSKKHSGLNDIQLFLIAVVNYTYANINEANSINMVKHSI